MISYSDFVVDDRYKTLAEKKLFNKYIDVFYASAMIGCIENKILEKPDNRYATIEEKSRIEKSTFINNTKTFRLYEKAILITYYDRERTKDESKNEIANIILEESEKEEYMNVLRNYAYAGIDILYDSYFNGVENDESEKGIRNIIDNGVYFMENFNKVNRVK